MRVLFVCLTLVVGVEKLFYKNIVIVFCLSRKISVVLGCISILIPVAFCVLCSTFPTTCLLLSFWLHVQIHLNTVAYEKHHFFSFCEHHLETENMYSERDQRYEIAKKIKANTCTHDLVALRFCRFVAVKFVVSTWHVVDRDIIGDTFCPKSSKMIRQWRRSILEPCLLQCTRWHWHLRPEFQIVPSFVVFDAPIFVDCTASGK